LGDVERAAETVARQSYGKLIAFLAARTRDVAGAEDALAEAFASALEDWPRTGVPRTPEAWLLTVARRRLADASRHRQVNERSAEHLLLLNELGQIADDATDIPDDRLRLLFACAHPAIDPAARAPLMLQAILGFGAVAIGSAFLVAPTAMGQRLVRAKNKIKRAAIPFRIPDHDELHDRLEPVLEAIYATYTEGWSDPGGADLRRRNLADEGLWLGRLLASLLPEEGEALGLLSLMLHTEARRASRRSREGHFIALAEQNTALWNHDQIDEAEELLHRARSVAAMGRFQLEAAIQSAHNDRRKSGRTDWRAIELLYGALFEMTGSPVVAINRAIAMARNTGSKDGATRGLAELDIIASDARLGEYQPYWAARAELLSQSGDFSAADLAYQRAIGLESDPAVRQFLQSRRRP
jgi:RNA polymerase sigma-70 factor, ECF subfamily